MSLHFGNLLTEIEIVQEERTEVEKQEETDGDVELKVGSILLRVHKRGSDIDARISSGEKEKKESNRKETRVQKEKKGKRSGRKKRKLLK